MEVISGSFGKQKEQEEKEQTLEDMLDTFHQICNDVGITDVILIGNSEDGGEMFSASNMSLADQIVAIEALKHSFFTSLMSTEV
jgi:hypothetical protein